MAKSKGPGEAPLRSLRRATFPADVPVPGKRLIYLGLAARSRRVVLYFSSAPTKLFVVC